MKLIGWIFRWLVKVGIFFTLFAFALNNQHEAVVNFFFGHHWRAPLVLVVLLTFTLGVGVGVLGMLPWWWRQRKQPQQSVANPAPATSASSVTAPPAITEPLAAPAYADGI